MKEIKTESFFKNIFIKGLFYGFLAGTSHLIVFNLLKITFKQKNLI